MNIFCDQVPRSGTHSPSRRPSSPPAYATPAETLAKLNERMAQEAREAAELEETLVRKRQEFEGKEAKRKEKESEHLISKYSIPITLDIMKILMQSFKNAKEVVFGNAIKVLELVDYYKIRPDCHLYNTYMSACERESRWRRCVAIYNDMRAIHKVVPNENTFEIIVNCCRNSIDESHVIFDTLRKTELDPEMCYRAALCNAANRVSKQVLLERMHELSEEKVGWKSEFSNKQTYQVIGIGIGIELCINISSLPLALFLPLRLFLPFIRCIFLLHFLALRSFEKVLLYVC